jgi:SAM-dependent methyltransferase
MKLMESFRRLNLESRRKHSEEWSTIEAFTNLSGTSWLQGRRLLPLLTRHGESTTGAVLDLGCGASPFKPLFGKSKRYIRMDRDQIDSDVIVIEDPLALPLPPDSVEVVLVFRMLGDLPDLVGVLQELQRVIVPGGRILAYETMSFPQHDLPHDYWRVLPAGLTWAAGRAGLEVREIEYLGGYFGQLAMHWNHYIIGALGGAIILRQFSMLGRALGNVTFGALDRIMPRPKLATDYFACLTKPLHGEGRTQ